MSSIGQSILMALTVTVNKYNSSNVQAVRRKRKRPLTNTSSDFGKRTLLLSTVVAALQVPESRTQLLKGNTFIQYSICIRIFIRTYVLRILFSSVCLFCVFLCIVLYCCSEYLKKSEENKAKNDKEVKLS